MNLNFATGLLYTRENAAAHHCQIRTQANQFYIIAVEFQIFKSIRKYSHVEW